MFGLAWTEIALIGVVAMVLIGPKDLPVAIKAVADVVKKARRMAGEFQVHVDEMMRDSNLREVRDSIAEIRRMDITSDIRRAVDADGSLHGALTDNPFEPKSGLGAAATATVTPGITEESWGPVAHAAPTPPGPGTVTMHAAPAAGAAPATGAAPAAGAALTAAAAPAAGAAPATGAALTAAAAPAFIPPDAAAPPA